MYARIVFYYRFYVAIVSSGKTRRTTTELPVVRFYGPRLRDITHGGAACCVVRGNDLATGTKKRPLRENTRRETGVPECVVGGGCRGGNEKSACHYVSPFLPRKKARGGAIKGPDLVSSCRKGKIKKKKKKRVRRSIVAYFTPTTRV